MGKIETEVQDHLERLRNPPSSRDTHAVYLLEMVAVLLARLLDQNPTNKSGLEDK